MSGRGRKDTAGWRLAARLARREVRRRPWRTALVTALVAIPVAGMVIATVLLRAGELSPAENWRFAAGQADAQLGGSLEAAQLDLPDGSRSLRFQAYGEAFVSTAGGRVCRCEVSDVPLDDPMTDGLYQVTSGRAPRRPDEILLSAEAAGALDARLGDEVALSRPADQTVTVVGLGVASGGRVSTMVFGPGADLDTLAGQYPPAVTTLVDLPDDLGEAAIATWSSSAPEVLLRPGLIRSPQDMLGNVDDATTGVRWSLVGGAVGLLVLGIVITAAFAASARRQLATLGQLAANGATPKTLRRVLFLQGTWTGVVGAGAGLLASAGILAALRPHLDRIVGHTVLGLDVRPLDLAPIVLLAVVAATVAAMVPAFGISRVSVLAALAGRRPLGRVSPLMTAGGLLLAGGGLALLGVAVTRSQNDFSYGAGSDSTAVAVAGAVGLLLGVCLVAPAYVGTLQIVAARLRGSSRLAARSLARQRTRTSALVAAIAATTAVAVAAAPYGLGLQERTAGEHRLSDLPHDVVRIRPASWAGDPGSKEAIPTSATVDAVAARVAAVLPGSTSHVLREAVPTGLPPEVVFEFTPISFTPGDGGEPTQTSAGPAWPWNLPQRATVVDDAFRRVYDLDDDIDRALGDVGAVLVAPGAGRAVVGTDTYRLDGVAPVETGVPTFTAAVVEPSAGHEMGWANDFLVTPEKAGELGLATPRVDVVVQTPAPLTAADREQVEQFAVAAAEDASLLEAPGAEPAGIVWIETYVPGRYVSAGQIEAGFAALAALLALAVVAAGLALAAAETRDERDVLSVLGAPPGQLRRTNSRKAALLTLLGAVLAIPVGVLPIAVVSRLDDGDMPFVVPWRTLAFLLLVAPLLAATLTSLATRVSLRLRPITASTMTFD